MQLAAYIGWLIHGVRDVLTAPAMLDRLGLAATILGALILVTQFVGYLAALRGFFWAPPHVETLRHDPLLTGRRPA